MTPLSLSTIKMTLLRWVWSSPPASVQSICKSMKHGVLQVYACSMECARPGNGRELILISREVRRARQDVLIHGSSSPVTCMSCDAISSNEPMVLSSQTKPGYILFRAPKWTRAALSQPACLGCTVSLLLFLRYTHWLLCIKSNLGQHPGKDSNCTLDHV